MRADPGADVDAVLVARLIANQFPRWARLPLTRVRPAGTDNAIYRLGTELAVRLPRLPSAAATVDVEQRWLPALAPRLPLAVALSADGTVDADADADAVTAAWETALAAPAWDGRAVWVHGDLYPVNLLGRHGHLTAVIDFGGLGVGDPACDLLPAWALLTADTRGRFRQEATVDDATWVRGRGWALGLGLGAAHVYRHTNPVLATIGRRSIAEAVADHQRDG
jgi:aminoglycoside phosphotransferase (APT) family kinase protein